MTSLGKIINMLRDLEKLAYDHHIEEYLYFGDGLIKVYHLLGDRRTTKFLATICDDNLTQQQTWGKLIAFLEREKKLHQQMVLINYKPDTRNEVQKKHHQRCNFDGASGVQSSSSSSSSDPVCFICNSSDGSSDHVSTPGPGGYKILQYYTYRTFVNKTPAARLYNLKEKGFCFQCLLTPLHHQESTLKGGANVISHVHIHHITNIQ